jgi:hypothetical protein
LLLVSFHVTPYAATARPRRPGPIGSRSAAAAAPPAQRGAGRERASARWSGSRCGSRSRLPAVVGGVPASVERDDAVRLVAAAERARHRVCRTRRAPAAHEALGATACQRGRSARLHGDGQAIRRAVGCERRDHPGHARGVSRSSTRTHCGGPTALARVRRDEFLALATPHADWPLCGPVLRIAQRICSRAHRVSERPEREATALPGTTSGSPRPRDRPSPRSWNRRWLSGKA